MLRAEERNIACHLIKSCRISCIYKMYSLASKTCNDFLNETFAFPNIIRTC